MNFIAKYIITFFLEKLWGVASEFLRRFISGIQDKREEKKIEKINKTQAEIVESIRQEIIALEKAGLVVPEELKERLREEARKLTSSISN